MEFTQKHENMAFSRPNMELKNLMVLIFFPGIYSKVWKRGIFKAKHGIKKFNGFNCFCKKKKYSFYLLFFYLENYHFNF